MRQAAWERADNHKENSISGDMLLKTVQWHGQHKFQMNEQRRIALTQLAMTTHLSDDERRKYEQLLIEYNKNIVDTSDVTIEELKKDMIAIKTQTLSALDADVVVTGVLPVCILI